MEQEYNIGDLWQWARSGELSPFTVVKDGQPVCRVIRVNGNNMDWLYAQYGEDDGTFNLEPFGMWGWPERMCCVREEYAGLGNWNLQEAEARARQAYYEEAAGKVAAEAKKLRKAAFTDAEMQAAEELAARLAKRGLRADEWAASGEIDLGEPVIYPGKLFLDEGQEIERIKQSIEAGSPAIQAAAQLVAALDKVASAAPPSLQPEPAPKPAEPSAQEPSQPNKVESARKAIVAALKGLRVQKIVVRIKGKGKKHNYQMRRVDLLQDLEKLGAIQPEHLGDDVKSPVTAKSIEKITKLNGRGDVLYSRE